MHALSSNLPTCTVSRFDENAWKVFIYSACSWRLDPSRFVGALCRVTYIEVTKYGVHAVVMYFQPCEVNGSSNDILIGHRCSVPYVHGDSI